MGVVNLTAENFDETIQDNDCVIVDFWAKWCGPCLAFAPVFESLSEKHPQVVFAKVDIEKETTLADDFQIRSIPFLMIFRREFAVFAESGTQTQKSLDDLIAQAQAIDLAALRQSVPTSKGEDKT